MNPNLAPPEELISIATARPETWLAYGVGRNPNLEPTEELMRAVRAYPYSRLAVGVAGNPALVPDVILVEAAERDPESQTATALASNPRLQLAAQAGGESMLGLPPRLVEVACLNSDTEFAECLAANPAVYPGYVLVESVVDAPQSRLARGLARNPRIFTWEPEPTGLSGW